MKSHTDRRKHPRMETALAVKCHGSSGVDNEAIALDISLSGAQILMNTNSGADGPLRLDLELDRSSLLSLRAVPVWSSKVSESSALLGVEFSGLGPFERCCLRSWMDDRDRFDHLFRKLLANDLLSP